MNGYNAACVCLGIIVVGYLIHEAMENGYNCSAKYGDCSVEFYQSAA